MPQLPTGTSAPNTVFTMHAVRSLHLSLSLQAYELTTPASLTPQQKTAARTIAAADAATIETASSFASLNQVLTYAIAIGMTIVLGVLAMTVGLIRAETSSELRVLTATGASRRTRRALTAITAATLGFVGAILGVITAYLLVGAFLADNVRSGSSSLASRRWPRWVGGSSLRASPRPWRANPSSSRRRTSLEAREPVPRRSALTARRVRSGRRDRWGDRAEEPRFTRRAHHRAVAPGRDADRHEPDVSDLALSLDEAELALLEPLGSRRSVRAGEYLYRAGDPSYDFCVVLQGRVDILLEADGGERVVASHGRHRFLGELNLLTGSRVYLSARVEEPGELLVVPADALRRVLATEPTLSDKILAAFMARRADLRVAAGAATRVIGSRYSAESLNLREFLSRCQLPYEWIDPDCDPQVDALLQQSGVSPADLPVVIAAGTVLRQATPGLVAEYLGLTLDRLGQRTFDLVVVGGGPAGLAAAVYGASEGLRTLGFDSVAPGGQAGTSSRIENYFGFATGISGGDLMQRGMIQAEKFGAQLTAPCAAVALRDDGGDLVVELADGSTVTARAVIAATGARYRRLDVDGLASFEGNGVYYAATELEARPCAGSPVVVVGGGNSAGQAAVFLADLGSEVTVAIRKPDLAVAMSRYLVDRVLGHERIAVATETRVVGLEGDETLRGVRLERHGETRLLSCAALFSFIGAEPSAEWLSGRAALDDHGFVLTDRSLSVEQRGDRFAAIGREPLPFETSHPGLFAVGDLRSGSTKRVAAAVGEGSSAVRSVHEHLALTER